MKFLNIKLLIYATLLGILMQGCKGHFYEKWQDTKEILTWGKSQKVINEVNIDDTAAKYSILFGLRHGEAIPYKTVGMQLQVVSPSGKTIQKEYNFVLKNEKGHPVGEVLHELADTKQTVETNYSFDEKGTYQFILTHTLPQSMVQVLEIGLMIDKNK
jgi:gliding motility-associated lipoprotein GldH